MVGIVKKEVIKIILITCIILIILSLVVSADEDTKQSKSHKKEDKTENNEPKISKRLNNSIIEYLNGRISQDEQFEIIIKLKTESRRQEIDQIKQKYKKEIKKYSDDIKNIFKEHKPKKFNSEEQEIEYGENLYQSFTDNDKDNISLSSKLKNEVKKDLRKEIVDYVSAINSKNQQPVIEDIKSKDGENLTSFSIFNVLIVKIPIKEILYFLNDSRIEAMDLLVKGMDAGLDISTGAIYASTLWEDYEEGYGPSPYAVVSVVDSGVNITHPRLKYLSDNSTLRTWYSEDFTGQGTEDNYGHGTHVAGIIASSDNTYKGVMYDIRTMLNAKLSDDGSVGDGDYFRAINWSLFDADELADVVSLSFGKKDDVVTDGESAFTRAIDDVIDFDITMAILAGNEGDEGTETLRRPGDGYNMITVGAIEDKGTTTRSDDVWAEWSHPINPGASSRGPTESDGRKKPDIVAPGTKIISTNATGELFAGRYGNGTSCATPHISAAAAWFYDVFNNALQTKALLINTAKDYGDTGWDDKYGWGYVSLAHAHTHIDDTHYEDQFTDDTPIFYQIEFLSNGDTATLVWLRHPCEDLRDIDLELYDESDGSLIDESNEAYDNVEQVESNNDYDSAVIKVEPSDSWTGNEEFAISTEEGVDFTINPPTLSASISNPSSEQPRELFNISAEVTPTGDLNAHGVSVTLTIPPELTIVSGSNPYSLGTINDGSPETAVWTVNSTGEGTRYFNVSVTSSSYGETYTAFDSSSVIISENINLYINIKTLKDNYTDNELVNITDPPEEEIYTVMSLEIGNETYNITVNSSEDKEK